MPSFQYSDVILPKALPIPSSYCFTAFTTKVTYYRFLPAEAKAYIGKNLVSCTQMYPQDLEEVCALQVGKESKQVFNITWMNKLLPLSTYMILYEELNSSVLSFLLCKTETALIYTLHRTVVRTEWNPSHKVPRTTQGTDKPNQETSKTFTKGFLCAWFESL